MKFISGLLLIIFFASPLPVAAASCIEQAGLKPTPVVEFDPLQNSLSVSARQSTLDTVLTRVATETGIEFIGDAGRCEDVSFEIEKLELARALAQILAGRNYMLEQGKQQQVTRVWILPVGAEDSMTAREMMKDEFYRELRGSERMEKFAEEIRQLEVEN